MFISCVFVYLSIYVIYEYIAEAPVILASGPQAVTVRAGIKQHDNKCDNILISSILKQSTEDLEKTSTRNQYKPFPLSSIGFITICDSKTVQSDL